MIALEKIQKNGIRLDMNDIMQVVNKYNVKELWVFGSSIRSDFSENSDLDFLISFVDSSVISLFDLIDIQEYFEAITNRKVDLVEPEGLRNPFRKKCILETKEILYAA